MQRRLRWESQHLAGFEDIFFGWRWNTTLTLQSLFFFQFHCFFGFPISFFFLCVLLSFSKDSIGSAKRKTLAKVFSGFGFFHCQPFWCLKIYYETIKYPSFFVECQNVLVCIVNSAIATTKIVWFWCLQLLKNFLIFFFLMGCFPRDFREGERPRWGEIGETPHWGRKTAH